MPRIIKYASSSPNEHTSLEVQRSSDYVDFYITDFSGSIDGSTSLSIDDVKLLIKDLQSIISHE